MKKLFILVFIIVGFISCNNHTEVSTVEVIWEIQTLRVDDDPEYHFTAITENGYLVSEDDLDYEIDYMYHSSNVTKPIIKVTKSYSSVDGAYWYDNQRYKIILPKGYKIETFED